MIHFEVAVDAPIEYTLTYSYEAAEGNGDTDYGTSSPDYIGRRVLVPLGRRKVTGYVLDSTAPSETKYTIRSITRFLDVEPLFHKNLIPFFRWLANYYHYPLGLIVKSSLPSGLAPRTVKKIKLIGEISNLRTAFQDTIPSWVHLLAEKSELGVKETKTVLENKTYRKIVDTCIKKEILVLENSLKSDGTIEKTEVCYSLPQNPLLFPGAVEYTKEGAKQFHLDFCSLNNVDLKLSETNALCCLQHLCLDKGVQSVALKDLRKLYSGAAKSLLELEIKGLVVRKKERIFRSPFGEQLRYYPRPDSLTEEQDSVLSYILPAVRKQQFQPYLLHGITGCGKTEVYLRAAEETLATGRDVLLLVPEIALATQLEAHLLSRFGDQVVLQHSGMSASERFDQFHLALSGKARIVIGARSAIFAPLKNPGLIVVDEEHDAGYKQDDKFRYHGRDIAVLRGKYQDAVVLLGSATPSVTSYANAKKGKYKLLTMHNRVGMRSLPQAKVVDLNKESKNLSKRIIKTELLTELTSNLSAEKQSILLLNRRGFSAVVMCRDCGTPVQCTHCHVSLTLHKEDGRLVCHYCGFNTADKTTCVNCRSTDLVPSGFGTERVEEEVVELLPEARVKRLDSDTASNRKKFLAVLADMHDGNIDILIGTQMIAKGHHFPNVTLVGVVWADGGMSMPDFRAAERTFQLITQVTGRAGRGKEPGKVIIQTMRPDHYAIEYAKNNQYEKLFDHEMRLRQHPAFPPFVRLTVLRIQGRVEEEVQKTALQVARFCRQLARQEKYTVDILGPAPAPLDKIKDHYRWQVLIRGARPEELHAVCTGLKTQEKTIVKQQCSLSIDVDPENMM